MGGAPSSWFHYFAHACTVYIGQLFAQFALSVCILFLKSFELFRHGKSYVEDCDT